MRKPSSEKPSGKQAAIKESPVTPEFMRHIEENAAFLRRQAGVGLEERLDPRTLAERFKLQIKTPDEIGLSPETRDCIASIPVKEWSGGGLPLPQGVTLIILHPEQTPERAAATIMEEVAHVHFGHQPSHLFIDATGLTQRAYDPEVEREAYWTAAAALLPSAAVSRRVYRGVTTEAIAAEFGVSAELVGFRIKILRLWKPHQARHPLEKTAA